MGVEFLSEPTRQDWGGLGVVRYVVAKDPLGNHVELVETDEIRTPGEGKVIRIFSINQNTADMDSALDLFADGAGMRVLARVEHSGDKFATKCGYVR